MLGSSSVSQMWRVAVWNAAGAMFGMTQARAGELQARSWRCGYDGLRGEWSMILGGCGSVWIMLLILASVNSLYVICGVEF